MASTYKVKLIPYPIVKLGTYGMAATIEGRKRSGFLPSPGTFDSIHALQAACEKADVALERGMPTPAAFTI